MFIYCSLKMVDERLGGVRELRGWGTPTLNKRETGKHVAIHKEQIIRPLTCDCCGESWTGTYEETGFAYFIHACPHRVEPEPETCEFCAESEAAE